MIRMIRTRPLLALGLCALSGFSLTDASAAPKKLLVVTITTGFRHGPAIDEAEKVLPELASKSGGDFTFEFLSQPGPKPGAGKAPERKPNMTDEEFKAAQDAHKALAQKAREEEAAWNEKVKNLFAQKFSAEGLRAYDGVVFCNTTGELPLPDGEAFRNWIKSGKAFVGMHSATDTLKAMPAYYELVNGSFAGHPWGGGGTYTFTNHEPAHPAVSMFPASFQWKDEIYQYNRFNPEAVRVLISLDTVQSTPKAPYHVPVSWVREVEKGRLFYTNLGHNAATWTDETYQKHIASGIRWALRLIDGPAAPNPLLSSEVALKSAAATIGEALQKDPAPIESKALAKARANLGWALEKHAEVDSLRNLPKADPSKPGDGASLAEKKRAFLEKLLSEIEK
jgi:type 1 glutamine amidotransferase